MTMRRRVVNTATFRELLGGGKKQFKCNESNLQVAAMILIVVADGNAPIIAMEYRKGPAG